MSLKKGLIKSTSRGSHITAMEKCTVKLQLTAVLFVQTMEPVDQLLQCVGPAKDREVWVRENKTGEIRPVDMEI